MNFGSGTLGALFLLGAFICILAPALLALNGKGYEIITITIALTIASIMLVIGNSSIVGQVLAFIVWLAAVICGVTSYALETMRKNNSKIAKKMTQDLLYPPR